MISVGITGQPGFVGTHLYDALGQHPEEFKRVPFEDAFFESEETLRAFVRQCDVIAHFAALVRSPKEGEVYNVNMRLMHQLIDAMKIENVTPCLLFSTSIQEGNGTEYGQSKYDIHHTLEKWAAENNTGFTCLIFPNLFGPGARPNSHSFIATFCYKLTHGEEPQVLVDNTVPLKYIGNLKQELLWIISDVAKKKSISTIQFEPEYRLKVTDVLTRLKGFINGKQPKDEADKALYETLISYKNYVL
jgi:UDP-2-acetamido-2,6-beta-L-arabino-hexul-4-ose reductase